MADKPSMNWVRALDLQRYDAGVARIGVRPGQRDVARFATTPASREQLARLFTTMLGRPVRVEIAPGSASGMAVDAEASQDDHGPSTAAASVQPGVSMQQAMTLPMVKQVMELFDVTLVEARAEEAQSPAEVQGPKSKVQGQGAGE